MNSVNLLKIAKYIKIMPEKFNAYHTIATTCGIAGFAALLSHVEAGKKHVNLSKEQTLDIAAEYTGLSVAHPLLQHFNSDWTQPQSVSARSARKAIEDFVATGKYNFV